MEFVTPLLSIYLETKRNTRSISSHELLYHSIILTGLGQEEALVSPHGRLKSLLCGFRQGVEGRCGDCKFPNVFPRRIRTAGGVETSSWTLNLVISCRCDPAKLVEKERLNSSVVIEVNKLLTNLEQWTNREAAPREPDRECFKPRIAPPEMNHQDLTGHVLGSPLDGKHSSTGSSR